MSEFKTKLKVTYLGGYLTSDIQESVEEATKTYQQALNNKKDRTLIIIENNNTVVLNLDNIVIFDISPLTPNSEAGHE